MSVARNLLTLIALITSMLFMGAGAHSAPAPRDDVRLVPEREPKAPSRAQIFANCMKDPNCREAMEQGARRDAVREPRPAAKEPSPEERELRELQRGAAGTPQASVDWLSPLKSLLRALNPIPEANAATYYYISPDYYEPEPSFSISLSTKQPYISSPYSYLLLAGAYVYVTSNYLIGSRTFAPSPQTEDRPYMMVRTTVPEDGEYVVNVNASRGHLRARHQYNGPVVADWDQRSSSAYWVDYTTVLKLAAGTHYFYFWPASSTTIRLSSVTIESR